MVPEKLLEILGRAEKLKCNTRHCYTSNGRHESVAEHSWRMTLMAMLIQDEFKDADIKKVMEMCLIHDLGEAFTGDIPTFEKKVEDEKVEEQVYTEWVNQFPLPTKEHWLALLDEMNQMETEEAKIYKALDKLEAIIQHDESDLSTWLPLEYELQYTYGKEQMEFAPYMKELRTAVDKMTDEKIQSGKQQISEIK